MLFNSLTYLIFLLVTFLIFHKLNNKYKVIFLLIASYIFYLWLHPLSPFILFFTTLIGYFFAIKISSNSSENKKKNLLFTSISINILTLILFREIFKSVIPAIGVSFFTFQNISYLIDCYLGKIEPENNILYYSLYIAFFPKLLQGPIERASNLIPQFKGNFICNYETLRTGALIFVWGMFEKVVIADNLALVIKKILNDIEGSSPLALLLITYFYAIQIYCDFSGYTDMALGSAKLFGINLTDNFNYPYLASSIQDFWRRWHITLSTWILDYIFKPLQMKWRNYGNYGLIASLIITFLLCGIWHGLKWNYIIWGLYHGILMSISFLTYNKWRKFCRKKKWNETLTYVIEVFITFQLVCFGWLIFMTKNLHDVSIIIHKIIYSLLINSSSISFTHNNLADKASVPKMYYIILLIFLFIKHINIKIKMINYFNKLHICIRWTLYYILILLIFLFPAVDGTKFIYSNF